MSPKLKVPHAIGRPRSESLTKNDDVAKLECMTKEFEHLLRENGKNRLVSLLRLCDICHKQPINRT